MTPAANTKPTLEVRGLTKRFGGLTAVKNLNFELRPGEIFGLIGPNGSGKSTAMKSVMGIERPTSGEVLFEGDDIAGLPSHKIARRGFGMVFQHSRPLNRQTVLENIPKPLRAILCAGRPAMFSPRKMTSPPVGRSMPMIEIGRASCRERV